MLSLSVRPPAATTARFGVDALQSTALALQRPGRAFEDLHRGRREPSREQSGRVKRDEVVGALEDALQLLVGHPVDALREFVFTVRAKVGRKRPAIRADRHANQSIQTIGSTPSSFVPSQLAQRAYQS